MTAIAVGVDASWRRMVDEVVGAGRRGTVDGLSVQVWLEQACRLLPRDARTVQCVASTLDKFPSLGEAWEHGKVSWSQLGPACRSLVSVPLEHRDEADARLWLAFEDYDLSNAEPGVLLDIISSMVAELNARRERQREVVVGKRAWLYLQPRLDGSGGRVEADYGPVGFAMVSDTIDAASPMPDVTANPSHRRQTALQNRQMIGQARAEGLLRLCSATPAPDAATARDVTTARDVATADGESAAGELPAPDGGAAARRVARRPLLLATVPLETLLGMSDRPGHLLTTLAGGTMRVTATAAKRLADHPQGADLRLLVNDESGRTVGVGRKTRVPPGWLRDAVVAAHPRCSEPGCNRAARLSDLDHLRGWNDDGKHPGGGRTDVDNLGPACGSHHTLRTRTRRVGQGWTSTVRPDGTIVHRHPVSGMTVTQPSLLALDRLASPPERRTLRPPRKPPWGPPQPERPAR